MCQFVHKYLKIVTDNNFPHVFTFVDTTEIFLFLKLEVFHNKLTKSPWVSSIFERELEHMSSNYFH